MHRLVDLTLYIHQGGMCTLDMLWKLFMCRCVFLVLGNAFSFRVLISSDLSC